MMLEVVSALCGVLLILLGGLVFPPLLAGIVLGIKDAWRQIQSQTLKKHPCDGCPGWTPTLPYIQHTPHGTIQITMSGDEPIQVVPEVAPPGDQRDPENLAEEAAAILAAGDGSARPWDLEDGEAEPLNQEHLKQLEAGLAAGPEEGRQALLEWQQRWAAVVGPPACGPGPSTEDLKQLEEAEPYWKHQGRCPVDHLPCMRRR